ncbi:hypothetical protein, partial [Serratia marcescens]|uniref:hypothetical protein n=1 Tax=Serratia marcescens TaxID=615 RepID=UPI001BD0844C
DQVDLQTSRNFGLAAYETLAEAAMFESEKLGPLIDGFDAPTTGDFPLETGTFAPSDWPAGAEMTCPYIDDEVWTSTNWDVYPEDY